ncbi:MAG: hypothetical protein ACREJN_08320 [Nitrospiraceae bacterium]
MAKRTMKARKPKIDPLEAAVMAQIQARMEAETAEITRNDYGQNDPKTTELVPTGSKELAKLDNFYIKLGITSADVAACPIISDTFKSIGGEEAVLDYLRASDDRTAKEIVRLYGSVPIQDGSGRKLPVPFEAFCVAAKVSRKKFLQLLVGEVSEQSDLMSNMLAASAHPKVVEETIRVATSDEFGASEARSILHKHRGFLPTPKTQNVNIRGNLNQDNRVDNSQNATINIGDLEFGNEAIGKATDRFNEARVFKVEESDEPNPVEAEFIETGQ